MRRRALLAASMAAGGGVFKPVIKIWLESINNGRITMAYASDAVASNLYAVGADGQKYEFREGYSSSFGGIMRGSTTIAGLIFNFDDLNPLPTIEDDIYIYKAVM